MLGADLFYEMLRSGWIIRPCFPVLKERVLENTLSGTIPFITSQWLTTQLLLRKDNSLELNLNRFSEVEAVEQSSMTAEQQDSEQHFSTQTTQQPDGRFVTWLPTKMDPTHFGSTRLSAEQRMHSTERRLKRDPDLKIQYHNSMNVY